jgi:hypothetical protein
VLCAVPGEPEQLGWCGIHWCDRALFPKAALRNLPCCMKPRLVVFQGWSHCCCTLQAAKVGHSLCGGTTRLGLAQHANTPLNSPQRAHACGCTTVQQDGIVSRLPRHGVVAYM